MAQYSSHGFCTRLGLIQFWSSNRATCSSATILTQIASSLNFFETTMLGAGDQPGVHNTAFSPVLHPAQSSES
jgi:hypothetical protein